MHTVAEHHLEIAASKREFHTRPRACENAHAKHIISSVCVCVCLHFHALPASGGNAKPPAQTPGRARCQTPLMRASPASLPVLVYMVATFTMPKQSSKPSVVARALPKSRVLHRAVQTSNPVHRPVPPQCRKWAEVSRQTPRAHFLRSVAEVKDRP